MCRGVQVSRGDFSPVARLFMYQLACMPELGGLNEQFCFPLPVLTLHELRMGRATVGHIEDILISNASGAESESVEKKSSVGSAADGSVLCMDSNQLRYEFWKP